MMPPLPIAMSNFQAPTLDALPAAPFVERWLFEQPTVPGAVLIFMTIVAFAVLRRMDRAKIALPIALLGVGAVIGLFVLDRVVVTSRERLELAARALVRAVAEPDLPMAGALLNDSVRLDLAIAGRDMRKAGILKQIPRLHAAAQLGDWRVPQVRAGLFSETIGRTQVRFKPDAPGFPRDSWWRVEWALETAPDGSKRWRATHIEPIWIMGIQNPGG